MSRKSEAADRKYLWAARKMEAAAQNGDSQAVDNIAAWAKRNGAAAIKPIVETPETPDYDYDTMARGS